jgi:transitional endoplasmic reticulum ATPase
MADEEKGVKLQVANMRRGTAAAAIARLPRSVMTSLGLSEGDVVELVGKRSTPARAVHPYPEDEASTSSARRSCSARTRN